MVPIRRLNWDEWNVAHIARHEVTRDEVEEVCHGDYVTRNGHHGRIVVIGPSRTGRMLAAILDPEPEPGVYFPVSARPARRLELRRYPEAKGGDAG